MNIAFATRNTHYALDYLQRALPSYIITDETAKPILDMVKDGKIRIGDPTMYGKNIPIYPDKNFEQSDIEVLKNWEDGLVKKEETL